MSSASEPPYPPGGQAALPARRARALPAAPRPDEAGGNEVDDATIPRSAVQRGTSGQYPGQGNSPGGPPEDWFSRTNAPQAGDDGQHRQGQHRQDYGGPGGFAGNPGMPGGPGAPGG